MGAGGPTVGTLAPADCAARLAGEGLGFRIGPFDVHLRAEVPGLSEPWQRLYRDYPLLDRDRVFNCHLHLREAWQLSPGPKRRLRLTVDGRRPHDDMPRGQGIAVLEWGLNLVIALRFPRYLMLHAAVLERDGRALLMPAQPGHGKTTLCAALAHRGWRLFSDEFGLVRPASTSVVPVPRPMPLKNASIAVIRAFEPAVELGPEIPGTIKGTVAHVRAPTASVARAGQAADARWIVFPRWRADARLSLEEVPRAEALMRLATNAFNYEMLGESAFETVRDLVGTTRCFRLVYSNLDEAIAALDALARDDRG